MLKINIENKKAFNEVMNIQWCIHPKHGQSYIEPDEFKKQLSNLSTLRRNKAIDPQFRSIVLVLLKSGYRHYSELKEILRNQPRRDAQKFIGKKNIREFIFKRDNYKCLCCGSGEKLSIDHIVPVNKNGLNRLYNLQTLCSSCNSSKSDNIIDFRI